MVPTGYVPAAAQIVIKSQVLAGGRGLGEFTNGLQGGVHIVHKSKSNELGKQMLGGTLVTKQTVRSSQPLTAAACIVLLAHPGSFLCHRF